MMKILEMKILSPGADSGGRQNLLEKWEEKGLRK